MVCSPPVVSKCLGEAHRRLELFTLHYIRLNPFFFSILLVIFFLKTHLDNIRDYRSGAPMVTAGKIFT